MKKKTTKKAAAAEAPAKTTTPVRNADMIPSIIVCTCSQTMTFDVYEKLDANDRRLPRIHRKIKLIGGANVTNRASPLLLPKQGLTYIVPNGTPMKDGQITEDDYKALQNHAPYLRMRSKGFFREVGSEDDTRLDAKGNAADMNPRDKSSQILDHEHATGTDNTHFAEFSQENHASTTAFAGFRDRYIGEQAAVASSYGTVPPPGQAV